MDNHTLGLIFLGLGIFSLIGLVLLFLKVDLPSDIKRNPLPDLFMDSGLGLIFAVSVLLITDGSLDAVLAFTLLFSGPFIGGYLGWSIRDDAKRRSRNTEHLYPEWS